MTEEDLGYKSGQFEQLNFEHSKLVKLYNKGFEKEDKKWTFEETKKHWRQGWSVITSN